MKKLAILGSTGSIGTQALQVVEAHSNLFKVVSLVAFSNEKLLRQQGEQFGAKFLGLVGKDSADGIFCGEECLTKALRGCDIVLVATNGIVALKAVLEAISKGIDVALANKEVLVCGGQLIFEKLRKSKSKLLTVDSEHSAIWQCLEGQDITAIDKLTLTASGGAFKDFSREQLSTATAQEALKHPTWNMGKKITIDSATMFNKGLEIIEACWLFEVDESQVEVLVHPQSIVHSMATFVDGSTLMQLSMPDMRVAIQFALTYPDRMCLDTKKLDLTKENLQFFPLDSEKFATVEFCREASRRGGLWPTALNACNDVLVQKFLQGDVGFFSFETVLGRLLTEFVILHDTVSYDSIVSVDKQAKIWTEEFLNNQQ